MVKILFKDILFVESLKDYIKIVTLTKTIVTKYVLSTLEEMLPTNEFLRIHKSFLINLHHVKEYQRGEGGLVIMSNGAEIEVSRRKKEQFLMKIKEVFKY